MYIFKDNMSRVSVSVSLRGEIIELIDRDRGLVAFSRYIDTIIGVSYGLDSPETLPSIPPFLAECIENNMEDH